jgi:hypothetical protein
MPRVNRVTPFGEIVAVPERGTIMGNRGVLHDSEGRIRRPWRFKRWLLCRLEFKGRHRTVMSPGRWTELFFLDEATGLAAGHRPCCECRRARFLAFRDAWAAGDDAAPQPQMIKVAMIDERLHAERINPDRSQRTFAAKIEDLPNGAFVSLNGNPDDAFLIWGEEMLSWSPGGYRKRQRRPNGEDVTVLTPASTVVALRSGYVPEVHCSAY